MSTNQWDVVTLAVRAEYQGIEDIVNVYDLQKTDATPADDASVLSDLEDWINLVYNLVAVFQTVRTLYREFKAYNKTQGTVIGTASITSPAAGTSGGQDQPGGVAALISFPTAYGRITGRKYIGGLVDTILTTEGTILSGSVAGLVSIGNTIRAPYSGTTSQWQYGIVRSIDNTFHVPTGTLVTNVCAYQRRRKRGRGS